MKDIITRDPKPNKLRTTRRGNIAIFMAGVALTGIAMKAGDVTHILWPDGHKYTQEQLDKFDETVVTVPVGAGAAQVVKSVEPSLVDDRQGFEDVSEYVTNQGIDIKDGHHVLHQRQSVLVPLVPGIPHIVDK